MKMRLAVVLLLALAAGMPAAAAAPGTGFRSGTDSAWISIPKPAPFQEPVIGGAYGGYIGMAGNWAHDAGCGGTVVWSARNAAQANLNRQTYHLGVGAGVYWFMGGPGVDPHYDGTRGEAYAWGQRQAAWTLADIADRHITYPVIFEDVEIPGHSPSYTPADDNGWNSVYTSACSGQVRTGYIDAAVDRATVRGYATYIYDHSPYRTGVYSAPDVWASIFGTGADAALPTTYEWTYESLTTSLAHPPDGWCLSGSTTCAQFFGGQTSASKNALMWQWSGGGGARNGYGDFDQIDEARTPTFH